MMEEPEGSSSVTGDHGEELKYSSLLLEGGEEALHAATEAKSSQAWKGILVFVLSVVLGAAVLFIGIDRESSTISFEYRGGLFRGTLSAFIVLCGAFLGWRIANDKIEVHKR